MGVAWPVHKIQKNNDVANFEQKTFTKENKAGIVKKNAKKLT